MSHATPVRSAARRNRLLGNFLQRRPQRPHCADGQFPLRTNALRAIPRIPGRYYLAIFVLAAVTLSFQILITRFFSVMLYYHFAFAAISLAMLGLTRGAMAVYEK